MLDTLKQLNLESSTISALIKNRKRKIKNKHSNTVDLQKRQRNHHKLQEARVRNKSFKKMQKMRAKLPAYEYQQHICDVIRKNTGTAFSIEDRSLYLLFATFSFFLQLKV